MKEQLQKRVQELDLAIQQAMANYNMLVGRLNEAKQTLAEYEKQEASVEAVEPANDKVGEVS